MQRERERQECSVHHAIKNTLNYVGYVFHIFIYIIYIYTHYIYTQNENPSAGVGEASKDIDYSNCLYVILCMYDVAL